jgi:hypothetical protein
MIERLIQLGITFTDEQGNARFYDNETDYQQDHSDTLERKIIDNWSTNFALHYTKSKRDFMKTIKKMLILPIMDYSPLV